jgi:(2Fe-2S) ferredoxin
MTSPHALWPTHIFVCTNERAPEHPRPSCGPRGGPEIRAWFKEGIKRRGWHLEVRASKSGCLEGCEAGPSVVVYPDAVWYTVTGKEDVELILDEHIGAGRRVEALLMDFTPLPCHQARTRREADSD